jgi:hypothetical protein
MGMQFVYGVIGFVAWTGLVIAATLWWARRQPKAAAAIGAEVGKVVGK